MRETLVKPPKFLEIIFAFYPLFQGSLLAFDGFRLLHTFSLTNLARFLFVAYLLSPLLWRLMQITFGPLTEGAQWMGKNAKGGNQWLLYHYLQSIYTHFSFFERVLKLIPGAYSTWLRLWGSHIGKKVIWTPECQIVDRGHLTIGDRVFIGNRSYLSAHALKKSKNKYFLYVKGISIGSDSMLAYASHTGPGVEIGSHTLIEAGARLYPNQRVAEGETYA